MKKAIFFRRIIACLLSVVSILSLCPVTFADETAVFTDDFSTPDLSGWTSTDAGVIENGHYIMPANTINYVSEHTYERVAISGDVVVYTSTKETGFPTGTTAYLVARGNAEKGTGYDFGIGVHTDGKTYVRMYRRDSNGTSKMLYQNTDPIEGIGAIQVGVSYNIKLITTENLVLGYVNDVLVAKIEDDAFVSGSVGLRTLDGEAQFDNVSVAEVPERQVEGISITEHDAEISLVGKPHFKGEVLYNSVYGTEPFDQDTAGVVYTGLDGKTGTKTVTVSYAEKQTQFDIQVNDKFDAQIIYKDDFTSKDESWKGGTANYGDVPYNLTIENGVASVTAPSTSLDSSMNVSLNRPAEEMAERKYYSVQAAVCITGDSKTPTHRPGRASVRFAQDPETGDIYELRLSSDGAVQVYRGSTVLMAKQLKKVIGHDFSFGTTYTLKVCRYDGVAEFYINGQLIGYSTDLAGTTGYAAIRAIAGSVKFDDYIATTIEEKGIHALTGIKVYSLESGKVIGNKTQYSFNEENFFVLGTYWDGSNMPIHLSETKISDYAPQSSAFQVITITYGGKSCKVNYAYKPYLFYDDFEDEYNRRWTWTEDPNMEYKTENGRMTFAYNQKVGVKAAIRGTVSDGAEWTNYEVSTDVFLNPGSGELTRYFGLVGRYASNSWYEFRIMYSPTGKLTGALARFNKGQYNVLQEINAAQLSACLESGEVLGTGVLYNVRMSLIDNTIKIYFNDHLLLIYTDDSSAALYRGTAGVRTISNSCVIDEFIVAKKDNAAITGFGLSQFPDGNVTLWQGNGIEIWNNNLIIKYADGTREEVMLTAEMLGDFSNTEVGVHEMDVTFAGTTRSVLVTVQERPEYIQEVAQEIETFSTSIDAGNVDAFLSLKKKFDALSPYEVGSIDAATVEKYKELLHSYDVYIAPELAGETLQENSTLRSDVLKTWGISIEGNNAGKWFQTNGLLYQAQLAYGKSLTSWKCPDVYGNISGISADIAVFSDMMYAGVGINVGKDGYYHARLANTALDENNEPLYELQFYRKNSSGHTQVQSIILEAYDIFVERGQWYTILLTQKDNMICVYFDGQLLIQFEETNQLYKLGEAGVRISQGDAIVDNVRVYGTKQERINSDSADLIEPTTYTDDFEDETVNKDPSHWVENYTHTNITDNWKIYDKGSKVYGTNASGYTETYLYAFDNNPTITTKLMVENLANTGEFGFITRMAPSTAFTFVGYDAKEEKWYVRSQTNEVEGPVITWQDETFKLQMNKWYEVSLTLKGKALTLVIDGNTLLSVEDVLHTGHGRFGFYTENASIYCDDYTVIMASGDIPQDGVISYVLDDDTYNNMLEIEVFDDGQKLLGISGAEKKYLSGNAGLTWSDVTDNSAYSQVIAAQYTTLLKMSNGKYLQILMNQDMLVQVSDDLMNWTSIANLMPSEECRQGGWKIALVHVNTATEVHLADGTSRIFVPVSCRKVVKNSIKGHYTEVFYSDDFGYTWQRSENNTLDVLPGATTTDSTSWAESKIIKCADGSLRMYYSRNTLGCMQYTVSHDNGVTWEGLYQMPHIQLPMTSYAIMEDPTEQGIFYMVCANGTPEYLGAITPRTRFVLLKSTDGMNWEFLMNIERMPDVNSVQNGVELYQILDPSLQITKDYVYITIGRSEREYSAEDASSHQAQRIYYVRVEKDKLQGRAWDASTIADMYYPKTIEFEQAPQTVFGVADLFVCSGTLKLTDFAGNVTTVPISETCTMYGEPDMFNIGESIAHLRYRNGTDLSYPVTIRAYYDISWDIYGEGTVTPMDSRIYDGDTGRYQITPAEGWKIDAVFVNEQIVSLDGNVLTLENLTENANIIVVFEEKTVLNNTWFWIVSAGGAVLLIGAVVTIIAVGKKRKKKVKSETSNSPLEN